MCAQTHLKCVYREEKPCRKVSEEQPRSLHPPSSGVVSEATAAAESINACLSGSKERFSSAPAEMKTSASAERPPGGGRRGSRASRRCHRGRPVLP